MIKFIARLFFLSVCFEYVLPVIHGISVHGNLLNSFGLAFLFCVLAWAISTLAAVITTVFAISTLGLALLVFIPLWIIGYWIFPIFILKLVATLSPQYITINGWIPAIWGGMILFFVGVLTDALSIGKSSKSA